MVATRIVIVEDSGIVQMSIHRNLVAVGYEVVGSARTREEAIQVVAETLPDLVLMDIQLGSKMDGIDAAEVIYQRFDIPIVYLTGYSDEETLRRAKSTGPAGYILKPFDARTLRSTIEVALYKHGMENKLKKSEARYRLLVEGINGIVWEASVNPLVFTYISPKLNEILGYDPATWIGSLEGWVNSIHPEDREQAINFLSRQIIEQGDSSIEYRMITAGGVIRWIRDMVTVVHEGEQCINLCGIMQDVTKEKHSDDEILRHLQELETFFQLSAALRGAQTHEEIICIVLDQLIALFQAAGVALASYIPQEQGFLVEQGKGEWRHLTGKLLTDDAASLEVIRSRTILNIKNLGNKTENHWTQDESECLYAVCAPLIARQQILGVLWLGNSTLISEPDMRLLAAAADITANALYRQTLYENLVEQLETLRKTQAQLLQSEKLATMGELVAGVAHELNNPLTSIVLYTQSMEQLNLDEEIKQDLIKINNEALRAAHIVRSLLDFSRQRALERKPVQINQIITESLNILAYELKTHGIELFLDLSPKVPLTMVDPYQMQQVILNLANNAWQAINQERSNGCLKVKTEVGSPLFSIQDGDAAEVIRILFEDDGPGITLENLDHIFDPFFTTKPEGTGSGMGLSVCHGIVTEHGGHIWAESNPGKGAKFYIELPILALSESEESLHREIEKTREVSKATRILLIDDETSVLEIVGRTLKRRGYEVDTADNATTALAQLHQVEYDLILCDMRMPKFNGARFYYTVKEKNALLANRIIFMTGDIVSAASRKFFDETGATYLAKPFEIPELLKAIRQALPPENSSQKNI